MMTLQEVADEMGISKQMVAKIEKRALEKARAILEQHGLTWEDFADDLREAEAAEDEAAQYRGEAR